MRKQLAISLCLAALLFAGCGKNGPQDITPDGKTGSVSLTFSTKGDRSTASEAYDGYAFHNLLVLLADRDGNLYDKKWIPKVTTSGTEHEHWDEKTVVFEQVQIGTYTVYAYANIDHETSQVAGSTIDDLEMALSVGDHIDPDRQLVELTGNNTPGGVRIDGKKLMASTGMILTGKNTLEVGVTSSSDSMALLRPVSRLNVYVNNHSENTVTLKSLSFSNFNASRTYLFDHSANGHPGIPSGNTYRALPSFDASTDGDIRILGNGRDSLVYSTVLYENENTSVEYRIFGSAEMNGVTKNIQVKNVDLKTYNQVKNMAVNAVWPVMLINPLTNNGKIIGNTAAKSANFKGGNKNYVTNFATSYSDDSDFIFYLKKTSSTEYSFYRDEACTTICTWGGESSFTIAQGTFTSGNSYDFANSDLCNFKTSGGNFLYNTGTTTLNTRSSTSKECQWAIYMPSVIDGSPLKVVDNQNGQVSIMDRMLRNQELNVIINVYYNQAAGVFDFDVDNAYWTGGHEMSHIFK